MKDIYLNRIVDLTDPDCIFIKDFDHEIRKYGALVYNEEYNSYQFIRHFSQIDYKKDLLPDFMKVEKTSELLNGLSLTIHYEFDPETEEDEENLEIWKQLSELPIPLYRYDDDGEINVEKYIRHYPSPSRHTVWFLKPESYDYIADIDLLMLDPIIKNLNIATTLIRRYALNPLLADYDEKDLDNYTEPDFRAVRRSRNSQKDDL